MIRVSNPGQTVVRQRTYHITCARRAISVKERIEVCGIAAAAKNQSITRLGTKSNLKYFGPPGRR